MAIAKELDQQEFGSIDELRAKFGQFVNNRALIKYRNRALPNSAHETTEQDVFNFVTAEKEDERAVMKQFRKELAGE